MKPSGGRRWSPDRSARRAPSSPSGPDGKPVPRLDTEGAAALQALDTAAFLTSATVQCLAPAVSVPAGALGAFSTNRPSSTLSVRASAPPRRSPATARRATNSWQRTRRSSARAAPIWPKGRREPGRHRGEDGGPGVRPGRVRLRRAERGPRHPGTDPDHGERPRAERAHPRDDAKATRWSCRPADELRRDATQRESTITVAPLRVMSARPAADANNRRGRQVRHREGLTEQLDFCSSTG